VSKWPEGISDGLTLPCALCGVVPKFDFRVTEECWQVVVGDAEYKRGVVCLPCFDRLAVKKHVDVSKALIEVQFTGVGKTIILSPQWTHRYNVGPTGKKLVKGSK